MTTSESKPIDGLILVGDVSERLKDLPDGVVQCIVTSPPYFNLRSYDDSDAWEGGDESCDHMQDSGYNKNFNARYFKKDVSGDRKQETHGKRPYRDECGKCGARRVKPWVGGNPECDHTASNARPDHSQKKKLGTRGEQGANAASVKPQPLTCRKCGAARITQQIGLEETPAEYVEKLVRVFRECRRVLRDDGVLYLNLGDSYAGGGCGTRDPERWPKQSRNDHMPTHAKKNTGMKDKDQLGIPHRVYFALQDDGWYGRQDIVWSKDNATPSGVKDRCVSSHEYIFLLSKSKTYYFDIDAIKEPSLTEPGQLRSPRSVWCFPTTPSNLKHHARFPEELPRRCIISASRPGDLVLDPFAGTGTTPFVAQEHGRRWVAIELVKDYVEMIRARTSTQMGML